MKIYSTQNYNVNSNKAGKSTEFKGKWYNDLRTDDEVFRTTVHAFNAGLSKRYYNAMKRISQISPESLHVMEFSRGGRDTYEYLHIENITNKTSIKRRLETTTLHNNGNYENEKAAEIVAYLEELGKKGSYMFETIFGKNPEIGEPASKGHRFKKTNNGFSFFNMNINPFFVKTGH